MTEKYLAPEFECEKFEVEEIITATTGGDNDYEDKWDL